MDRTIEELINGQRPASPDLALCRINQLLVVTAHPDDESFGLGAVLSALAQRGTRLTLLCLTQGEQSTLGTTIGDLRSIRRSELEMAAAVLGIQRATLLEFPDGRLAEEPIEHLVEHVQHAVADADALLVFDEGGVTGHPDHQAATRAALLAAEALDLPVLSWSIPSTVANRLNAELGTAFVGRNEDTLDISIEVDRRRQLEAIACHGSQSRDNPVLWRRLSLLGDREWLRYLRPRLGEGCNGAPCPPW